ncbi:DUF2786 domain-containing protein [Antrihabitans cavernicola]|uniref:DUF2786 domain-containing protein n=1 Tax=Antrihabitans cavernicola TaxID=2495913 RepID=A0A5A7S8G2_9NOCA|nr:DUF2786 domain-containing protein [Spelaeibacter cavernicola]KAA0018464.1 DUF2786 domain-containing protein [Spelaeibacter cavernicola]
MSSEKMLTRIGGLLRQAESTDNEHEAEAFLAAAQRLATQSSIDLAVARSHISNRERRPVPSQRIIRMGEPGKKGLRTYVQLFLRIAAANDVRCDIAQSSTQVYAYGFDTDIDACEALYASLIVQMVRSSDLYIKSGRYRDETVERLETVVRGRRRVTRTVQAPLAGVTARLNFQLAYADRIGKRLDAVKREAEVEVVAAATSTETALALRDKQIELRDFYKETSPARGTWRGGKAAAGYSSAARRAGDRAGRSARLGMSPELGGARGELSS